MKGEHLMPKQTQEKTSILRTRPLDADCISTKLAVITLRPFTTALSLKIPNALCYLQPVSDIATFDTDEQGRLVGKSRYVPISAEVEKAAANDYNDKIDLLLLRKLYTLFLELFESGDAAESNSTKVKIYLPDLLASLGLDKNPSQKWINGFLENFDIYCTTIGVDATDTGSIQYWRLLDGYSYCRETNTVEMASPYMEHIVRKIDDESIVRRNGKIFHDKAGNPLRNAAYTFLIKPEIAREKNKAVIENICNLVVLIEQAGSKENGDQLVGSPHISAKSLIERNCFILNVLTQNEHSYHQKYLNRTFAKTWNLLLHMTTIKDVYTNIQLPTVADKDSLPKLKSLGSCVYTFAHAGKPSAVQRVTAGKRKT